MSEGQLERPGPQPPAPDAQPVGLVGVGAMGGRMARNLIKRGFELVICDTVVERTKTLEGPGVVVAARPRQVAEQARRVITMLPTLSAIEEVVLGADGLVEGAGSDSVLIEMSSSTPVLSRRLSEALASRGVRMLDVPVSGTTPAAEAATLVGMVGGDPGVLEDCRPVLEAMCKAVYYCGGPGQGNAMKLALNLLIYVPSLAAFESMALAARVGLNPRTLLDVISSGAADSYIVKYKLSKALEGDYLPGGSVDVAVKDLELAIEMAQQAGVPMLLPPLALQAFLHAQQAGLGGSDTAVLMSLYEKLLKIELER